MKHLIKSLLLLMLAISAYRAASQTPLEFNDKLTVISDSAYVLGKEWGTQFISAHKTKDYASLRPYRERIERYIIAEITVVEGMKDVEDSRDLRLAMLGFLRYELSMIQRAFTPLERLGKYTPHTEVEAYLDQIRAYTTQEAEEMGKVYDAQDRFAKANGFVIEGAKEER